MNEIIDKLKLITIMLANKIVDKRDRLDVFGYSITILEKLNCNSFASFNSINLSQISNKKYKHV